MVPQQPLCRLHGQFSPRVCMCKAHRGEPVLDSILSQTSLELLRLEFWSAVTGDGVRHAHVLEELCHHVHQAGSSTPALVYVKPAAEAVHHHAKVVAMEGEVVTAYVLEGVIGWTGGMFG